MRFATFWVRLEEVPVEFRTTQFGVGLLQPVGQVLHAGIFDSPMENREFVRGFVRIDVNRPLLGRRKARFSNGGEFWVQFGYEGLPMVCFGCGLLGHSLRQCTTLVEEDADVEDRGPWMQAQQRLYHQVRRGGTKRTAGEASSGDQLLVAAAPENERKKPNPTASFDLGSTLANSSLDKAGGPSGIQAHQKLSTAICYKEGLGPLRGKPGSIIASSSQGLMGQPLESQLMDCSEGAQVESNEVQPHLSSILYDLSGLYITNPAGSFDKGLPIGLQVANLVASMGGQIVDAKVDGGADQNRPAKGP
ncbi:hypothetical protein LINPERHAP1_LOCUS13647 [Linum perenne]